jgi:hypothetical protein
MWNILSQMNPVRTLPTYYFIINFNITLPITLDSSRHLYDQTFPQKVLGIIDLTPRHACYISHNFVLIGLGTNYTAPHCIIFYRLLSPFLSMLSKYPLITLFSDTLGVYYSVSIRDLISDLLKITHKITTLIVLFVLWHIRRLAKNYEQNGSKKTRIYFAFSFPWKWFWLVIFVHSRLNFVIHSEYLLRKKSLHPKACQVHHVTFIPAESRHTAFLSAAPNTQLSKRKLSLVPYV